jgi:transaldolase
MPDKSGNGAPQSAGKKNPLRELEAQGQGVWLDFIRRKFLLEGGLKKLVEEDGLSGVTSNPTIFEKAVSGGNDYDEQFEQVVQSGKGDDVSALFDAMAVKDIQTAADTLRPVYDRTKGVDGYVSLEVSPELARDTQGTIRDARTLWAAVGRPNLLIKVPATPEGIPAVEELLASGVNVNITLMFSMQHYENVAQAYIRGLKRCATPEKMGSVASFFVSRVDNMIDPKLEKIGTPEALALRGKIGIANCKVVCQRFKEIFEGSDFADLRKKGARVQRVLWASTSTKNPAYPDTLYVAELIGPHTVNTLPPATIDAFRDHGVVRGATILENVDEARLQLNTLAKLGIRLNDVTEQLQVEGVESFSKSFKDLEAALDKKRNQLKAAAGR